MAPTVLITGASQGIGKATALLFARKGYDLVLAARQVDRLESVAQEVQSLGRTAPLVVSCDVTDPAQVKTLVEKALDHYGNIDVLVNNAGVFAEGPVEAFSLEDWHRVIDLNLWGYIHTINALLPHFLQRRTGTIVNLSSIAGKVPNPYLVVYCTSKFAVTGMTQALHAELKPKGIHVCGIHPNLIKSSLMERAVFRGKDEEDIQSRRDQLNNVLKVPVVEKPEDVANAIWDALMNQKSEIMVGSAGMSQGLDRLFPGLVQWLSGITFKNKDK
ncbi:SDR family NAD(P)-dependent oxidoreductase [Iningainema tapete]|uniref:SDR family oxidoreductase n=1 Tax=Iningainema tapete BLCC-T55 TaxID=2748662 RepID=A0A8J7CHR8_9CYAN|nr:SDR family oxidoreductase [Iningainema tapete]MBD2778005.1 SDR family oxidoreductase [Iningainema tapete BLCC-T55]